MPYHLGDDLKVYLKSYPTLGAYTYINSDQGPPRTGRSKQVVALVQFPFLPAFIEELPVNIHLFTDKRMQWHCRAALGAALRTLPAASSCWRIDLDAPPDPVDELPFRPFRRTAFPRRGRQKRAKAAQCASVRPCRLAIAKGFTRSPVLVFLGRSTNQPKTSLFNNHRHAVTSPRPSRDHFKTRP
jgi:hypothetical protein